VAALVGLSPQPHRTSPLFSHTEQVSMAHLAGTSTDLRHNDIGVEYENEFDKLRWGFRYGEVNSQSCAHFSSQKDPHGLELG